MPLSPLSVELRVLLSGFSDLQSLDQVGHKNLCLFIAPLFQLDRAFQAL